MADTLLAPLFQKLNDREMGRVKPDTTKMEEVKSELRLIQSLLTHNKVKERRRPELNYFLGDLIEMVPDAFDLNVPQDVSSVLLWAEVVNRQVCQLLQDTRPDGDGDRDGDGDGDGDGDVVGLEDDVELLLRRAICNEEKSLSISLIHGMVGIGKTALARHVYGHKRVVDQFERRAWVRASTDLSHKELLMQILEQVVVNGEELDRRSIMEKTDNRNLQRMLHRRLKGTRFFIVLDDWPKQMRLKSILKALPGQVKGSRLMVTSRMRSIPTTLTYVHEMKALDSNKSWKLFLKTIGDNDEFPKKLEKKGREMLTKCEGLPLAIKEVGKQLAEKRRSGSEWEQLLESSIDLGSTLKLLEMRLENMDGMVRSYFLRLCFFKERTTMRAKKLMHVWTAQGTDAELYARMYIYKLSDESIIDVKDSDRYYGIKSCGINALVHMLSIRQAEEEIGFEIVKNGYNRPSESVPLHRVIYCSRDNFNYSRSHYHDYGLVSLFFYGGGYFDTSPSYWENFEQLKVLDLEGFGIRVLPETVGSLMELCYLGLRNNYIQQLPLSLGNLKRLQVLDIAQNFMVEIPDVIWKMVSLNHLYLSDVVCHKPLKIDVVNLHSLTYISVNSWVYELSGMETMTGLHNVGIDEVDGIPDLRKLFASLARLKILKNLILRGSRFRSMPCLDDLGILRALTHLKLDGRVAKLPSAGSFPPNIHFLTMVNSCLDQDPMPVLEKLPKLIYLRLRNAYTGRRMVVLQQGFPMLQRLCMEELWNLRNVRVEEGAMAKLSELEVNNCPYLETLPEEMMIGLKKMKMATTKNIEKKIRGSGLMEKVEEVEINRS